LLRRADAAMLRDRLSVPKAAAWSKAIRQQRVLVRIGG